MQVEFASRRSANAATNADFVSATPNVVVVLDGSSSPPGLATGCVHSASWFVYRLGIELLKCFTMEINSASSDLLMQAITNVNSFHIATCDIMHPGNPSCAVAVLRERDETIDFLVVGSTIVLLEEIDYIRVVSDAQLDNVAGARHKEAYQKRIAYAADRLRPPEPASPVSQYGHIDWKRPVSTSLLAVDHAMTGNTDRRSVHRAAVLSDGAAQLANESRLVDWRRFLDQLEEDGPEALIDQSLQIGRSEQDRQHTEIANEHDNVTAVVCRFRYRSHD